MLTYTAKLSAVTALNTAADLMTITAGSVTAIKITQIIVAGQATLSAANVLGIYRVGTLGAIPVALTAQPTNARFPAANSTVASGWTTQPVVGALLHALGFNGNGGVFNWVANQALGIAPIVIPAGVTAASQLSFRSLAGTSLAILTVMFEEI